MELQQSEFQLHMFYTMSMDISQILPDDPGNVDLCQYFGQKKSKDYAAFLSSSSSFC